MSVQDVVAQTIAVLIPALPYVKKAGESVAGEIGKESLKKAVALFTSLKQRFQKTGAEKAERALDNFADEPEDYQEVLAKQLTSYLELHPDALDEVKRLLADEKLQEVIATNESTIDSIKMKLTGAGKQSVRADKKSSISGVDMVSE